MFCSNSDLKLPSFRQMIFKLLNVMEILYYKFSQGY